MNATTITGSFTWAVWPKNYQTPMYGEKVWCVLKYQQEDGTEFTAKGTSLPAIKGVPVRLVGNWSLKDGKKTFAVESFMVQKPKEKKAAVEYLKALRCGIGPARGEQLISVYGPSIWEVLAKEPETIAKAAHLSKKNTERLIKRVSVSKIERFLARSFDGITIVSPKRAEKVIQRLGADAIEQISVNPFILWENGFSFKELDALSQRQGIPPDAFIRQKVMILSTLIDYENRGNTCIDRFELLDLLKRTETRSSSEESKKQALNRLLKDRDIRTSGNCVYRKRRFEEECSLAGKAAEMLKTTASKQAEDAAAKAISASPVPLGEKQKQAVLMALENNLSIITGGPGTGKTTVLKAVLNGMAELDDTPPILMSPTGKAARRLSEATGYPASTIHSAIGYKDDEHGATAGEINSFVVVDEASMLDLSIGAEVFRLLGKRARLLLVGDPDQLPPVGAGSVLADLISSGCVPVTKLDEIHRQKKGSLIIENAIRIRDGNTDLLTGDDFQIIEEPSVESIAEKAVALYADCVKKQGIENVFMVCPVKTSKAELNSTDLNRRLQSLLNSNTKLPDAPFVSNGTYRFFEKDRVMQLKNTEGTKNGDVGTVLKVYRKEDEEDRSVFETRLLIKFDDYDEPFDYGSETFDDLSLAYCSTVHKSQGEEYKTVIVAISETHGIMLRKNMLYTAATRSRERLFIVTEIGRRAISKSILNNAEDKRTSLLASRLHHIKTPS